MKNKEDMEYELMERWVDNIWCFCNALILSGFNTEECSKIIRDYQLLVHSVDKFDKRKKATVTINTIPPYYKFTDALREEGVPVEYMDTVVHTDYVTVKNILERADVLERYPDLVKMMDDAIIEWKIYGDDVL